MHRRRETRESDDEKRTDMSEAGGIDCDVHPTVPGLEALVPYMNEHWQDMVHTRGLDELVSISYPANSPITARADWRPAKGKPAGTLEQMRTECLDPFKTSIAICNCLYGAQLLFSEDMGSAFASAVNDWIAKEWLQRGAGVRGSDAGEKQNAGTGGEGNGD